MHSFRTGQRRTGGGHPGCATAIFQRGGCSEKDRDGSRLAGSAVPAQSRAERDREIPHHRTLPRKVLELCSGILARALRYRLCMFRKNWFAALTIMCRSSQFGFVSSNISWRVTENSLSPDVT